MNKLCKDFTRDLIENCIGMLQDLEMINSEEEDMYFEKESFLHFSKCITVAQVADLFLHVGLARNFQLALSPAFQKSL